MRDIDFRGGSNLISAEERGPLSYGEARLLEAQHKNRSTEHQTHDSQERARLKALTVDADKKRVRHGSSPWLKDFGNQ